MTRAKSNIKCRRLYSRPVKKSTGLRCDQTIVLTQSFEDYPEHLRLVKFYDAENDLRLTFLTNNFSTRCLDHRTTLQMPLESRAVFQMDQTASADQGILWHIRERRQDSSLDSRLDLRPDCDYQKAAVSGTIALYDSTDFER